MVVGQSVKNKFTWLLDNVEVKGIVREISAQPLGDDYALEPDPNYRHLISYFPGINPLMWENSDFPGCIHCETYPIEEKNESSNRDSAPWLERDRTTLKPRKPKDVSFTVFNSLTGQRKDLDMGDHVCIESRWVIDHHPEYCERWLEEVPCDRKHVLELRPGGRSRAARVRQCFQAAFCMQGQQQASHATLLRVQEAFFHSHVRLAFISDKEITTLVCISYLLMSYQRISKSIILWPCKCFMENKRFYNFFRRSKHGS
jgi:hypothetical protein